MPKPVFCPNCGESFSKSYTMQINAITVFFTGQYDSVKEYKCKCGICGWEGNIHTKGE